MGTRKAVIDRRDYRTLSFYKKYECVLGIINMLY